MDDENLERIEPFSVKLVLSETLAFCSVNKAYLFDSLKYLCLGVLVIDLFNLFRFGSFGLDFFVGGILAIYLKTLLAVKCHRMFLLNDPVGAIKDNFLWKKRDTEFVVYGLMLGLLMFIIFFPIMTFFSIQTSGLETIGPGIAYKSVMIPIGYTWARLSLMFPAIAIDKKEDFSNAWMISKGNGWKLFFLIYLLPGGFRLLSGTLLSSFFIFNWILSVVGNVIFIFEVLVLSNSYRHLSRIKKVSAVPQEG